MISIIETASHFLLFRIYFIKAGDEVIGEAEQGQNQEVLKLISEMRLFDDSL